jgi:hypothetical protein
MFEKSIRFFATTLLATGLVAGSLQTSGGDREQAVASSIPSLYYREDELPAYPNAAELPLGDSLAINGIGVRLSHFTTADSPEVVRDFYLRWFSEMGAPLQQRETKDGGFVVTATIAGGSGQAVVAIAPRGKATDVFPSVFPMSADASEAQSLEEIPFSPNAVGILRVADSQTTEGTALTWQEPVMTAPETIAWLREGLSGRGWRIVKSTGLQIVADRGGRTAHFQVTRYRFQDKGASVFVKFEEGASGEPSSRGKAP